MRDFEYQEPARSVIAEFGDGSVTDGIKLIAQITGRDTSTVLRWMYPKQNRRGTGGLIPSEHIPQLLAEAEQRRIPLGPRDFIQPRNGGQRQAEPAEAAE